MAEITTIFFDVGGVLLTNGWDTESRKQCADTFDLDWGEFEGRHEYVADGFETGRLTLEEYLDHTVFHRPRAFGRDAFAAAMKSQSQLLGTTLEYVRRLPSELTLATLNNESRELNDHRIAAFGLTEVFDAFFSSGYLGVKKPDDEIFELALDIMQADPRHCLFVDDRELNLECAGRLGIDAVLFDGVEGLRQAVEARGIG